MPVTYTNRRGVLYYLCRSTVKTGRLREQFFEDFIDLPVCTVISTSQVAKNFATHTPDGDYVEFEDGRRWIPQIELHKVRSPCPSNVR